MSSNKQKKDLLTKRRAKKRAIHELTKRAEAIAKIPGNERVSAEKLASYNILAAIQNAGF